MWSWKHIQNLQWAMAVDAAPLPRPGFKAIIASRERIELQRLSSCVCYTTVCPPERICRGFVRLEMGEKEL